MAGAGISESSSPKMAELIWFLIAILLLVSFVITSIQTFKTTPVVKKKWYEKWYRLPFSLVPAFCIFIVSLLMLEVVVFIANIG
jgi:hypothetical protein